MSGDGALGRALFPTALGPCGVAWGPAGIVAVQLPEADAEGTTARLRRRVPRAVPADPPPDVGAAVEAMTALLDGLLTGQADRPADGDPGPAGAGARWTEVLVTAAVDLTAASDFERRVYDVVRAVPVGETRTYGEVAAAVGEPGGAQAVGRAMAANPVPILVPCHRVVGAGGRPVGFSAAGGVATKRRMLRTEGATAGGPPTLFD